MLGLWTHGDLLRPGADVEKRRIQMRDNLWMAMALCHRRVTSWSYLDELFRNSNEIARPNGENGAWIWTSLFVRCLVDGGLLDGWNYQCVQEPSDLGSGGRDTYMVEQCRQHGLTMLHRDDGAGRKARKNHVAEMSPQAYAESVMPWDRARATLLERIDAAINAWPDKHPPAEESFRIWEANYLRNVYLLIADGS